MAKASNTTLNGSGDSGHSCLVSDLNKRLPVFHQWTWVSCGFAVIRSYYVEMHSLFTFLGLPWWLNIKEFACSAGDAGSVPGLRRSPGEGNGSLLQYACLGNLMDRGDSQATVHEITRIGHSLATKLPPPTHTLQEFSSWTDVEVCEMFFYILRWLCDFYHSLC